MIDIELKLKYLVSELVKKYNVDIDLKESPLELRNILLVRYNNLNFYCYIELKYEELTTKYMDDLVHYVSTLIELQIIEYIRRY